MSGHHAEIAPSSLARTVACNAWIKFAEGVPPEPDKPATLEGNAADWVAKETAQGREPAYASPTPTPGYPVDYDMLAGGRLWAATIGYGSNSGVPVFIERVHKTKCWGSPDGWKYDGIEQILHVPDYKYGFDLVEVFENWQVMSYAIGLIDTLGLDDQVVRVRLTIVQPRAFHPRGPVRSWTIVADQLRAYANIMHTAAEAALGPSPTATVGPHCMSTYCPARHQCPTLQTACGHVAEWAREGETVHKLTPEAIGTELTILRAARDVLDARITGLEPQVEELMRSGHRVRGFKAEASKTHLTWEKTTTVEDILGLGALAGKDMRKPLTVSGGCVTAIQAKNAGVDPKLIDVYASIPPGKVKIVADDGAEARQVFGAGPE